jgi:hypothetical protein
LVIRRLYRDFARLEEGEQRCMARGNAQITLRRRRKHHLGIAREQLAFGADDVDVDGVCFCHVYSLNELALLKSLCFRDGFFNGADHVEGLLGERVEFAAEDTLEPADGVLERDDLAVLAREYLRDVERL